MTDFRLDFVLISLFLGLILGTFVGLLFKRIVADDVGFARRCCAYSTIFLVSLGVIGQVATASLRSIDLVPAALFVGVIFWILTVSAGIITSLSLVDGKIISFAQIINRDYYLPPRP